MRCLHVVQVDPWVVATLCLWASVAAAASDPQAGTAQRLDALFADTFEARLEIDPSLANRVGDDRAPGRMTVSLTDEYRARERELLLRAAHDIEQIPLDELDPRRRTWAEAFRWVVVMGLELNESPTHLLPLIPGADLPSDFAHVAAGDADLAMDTADDLRHYVSRAKDLERWVETAIRHLRQGAAREFVHPELVVRREIQAISALLSGERQDTVFWRPVRTAESLDLPDAERQALRDQLVATTESVIVPAYAHLHRFLSEDYLPRARPGLGLADLEGGPAL